MSKETRFFFLMAIAMLCAAFFVAGCAKNGDDDSGNATLDDDTSAGDDSAGDDNADDDTAVDDDSVLDDDSLGPVDNPLIYVNPFTGTGGLGYGMGALIPGPILPNAPVKLTPDTSIGGLVISKLHAGGYYYPEHTIRGISHTHLPGTGMTELANINLMPVMGMTDDRVLNEGYRSNFRHATEQARPGYYRVTLDRFGIDVELTSTMFVGLHRYTFPASADAPYVVIDVSYANQDGASTGGEVTVDTGAGEVYGYMSQNNGYRTVYFVARFSEPIADYGTFTDNVRDALGTNTTGTDIGAYVGFAQGTTSAVAKVGLSFQSVLQARTNLDEQAPDWDFDGVVTASENVWKDYLSDVLVEGGTLTQRRNFYSALYHCYYMPTSFTEDGSYVGFDRTQHQALDFTYYTDFSLWDTFRSLHPLMILLRPSLAHDFVVSLVKMYEQGGQFPRWALGEGDTGSMIGTHADSVIAEAWVKGITDFDAETAYPGLRAHAVGPVPSYGGRDGVEDWVARGWLPQDLHGSSVSKTLEYAYDDWCLAQLAGGLGETADRDMFLARSKNYANLFDPDTKYFRARTSDGNFLPSSNFLPSWLWYDEYVEGNARQWRWFVPHDVPGLIDLFGDPDYFRAQLEDFFSGHGEHSGVLPDLYYYHGNEPDIHAAYLFNDVGRPDLTARSVRWIMSELYKDGPGGIYGNDDGGTLSAWYVLSAIGLYPVAPCSGVYYIGSPLFTKSTVRMGDKTLVITAENSSDENIYIQSATLNGTPLDVPFVHHSDIANGGTLDFVMGPQPSAWGQQ